jgi:hypothetical protein
VTFALSANYGSIMRKSGGFIDNLICSDVPNLIMRFTDLLRAHLWRNIGMEGKWVAAAYMKNRDRFAGGNQQVSPQLIKCDYWSFYYKFNRGTRKFYELLCSPTEYSSTLNLWIHEHGRGFTDTVGGRNLVLNLVQQHRRHTALYLWGARVHDYMYDI